MILVNLIRDTLQVFLPAIPFLRALLEVNYFWLPSDAAVTWNWLGAQYVGINSIAMLPLPFILERVGKRISQFVLSLTISFYSMERHYAREANLQIRAQGSGLERLVSAQHCAEIQAVLRW
jgi:hypothetical protein